MSLHVQLSPEALENLRRQRRNSSISSIFASALVIVILLMIMGIFMLDIQPKESPTIVTYVSNSEDEDQLEERKVNTQIQKKPSAPSSSMSKVIASTSNSAVSIPVPDVDVTTPSLDFGDGHDFGGGWGDSGDFGTGGGFSKIPSTMRKRCDPQERMSRLKESGGSEEGEAAVVKALDYLQTTQNSDGSWDDQFPVAMTGLALLAYLGHCETPQSKKYGDTVLKAITYLISVGDKESAGRLATVVKGHEWVYEHGIATYALAEAYTFCSKLGINIPDLAEVTKRAGEIIMDGQSSVGGWNYNYAPTPTGDNSVGFWQIQAMKACKHTGMWPDTKFKKHADLALQFLRKVQGSDGAIGYREDSKRSPNLTGGGVLAFQMWDEGDSDAAKKGIEWIDQNSKFTWGKTDSNLYYHYYKIQAMLNHGGKEWDKYNEMIRDPLIAGQSSDGSWDQSSKGHGPINTHMTTCLATLTLEAYYRFLPSSAK